MVGLSGLIFSNLNDSVILKVGFFLLLLFFSRCELSEFGLGIWAPAKQSSIKAAAH